MRKMLVLFAVVAAWGLAALIGPASAFACDTSYWNVHLGCENYPINASHSAYPGATPNNIYVRLSADPYKWFYGKTSQYLSNSAGNWVATTQAAGYDDYWIVYVGLSYIHGGCWNSSGINGTIFINCATHLY
jgi:hypothetical protein